MLFFENFFLYTIYNMNVNYTLILKTIYELSLRRGFNFSRFSLIGK